MLEKIIKNISYGRRRLMQGFFIALATITGCGIDIILQKLGEWISLPFPVNNVGTIFISALCGYIPGIFVAIGSFLYSSLNGGGGTGFAFINMVVAMAVSGASKRGWLKSVWKTAGVTIVLAGISGGLQALLSLVVAENFNGANSLLNIHSQFLVELESKSAVMLLLFIFLRYAKDRILLWFPNGKYYTRHIQPRNFLKERHIRRTSLSSRITMIVTLISIVQSYAAILIFHMYNQKKGFSQITSGSNRVAFDFEMATGLLAVALVVVLIANAYAQWRIAKPINEIAKVMDSFAYNTEDGRMDSLQKIKKLKIHTGDEIETLYHSIDKTTEDFQKYLEEKEREQQLQTELLVAKASNEAKSNFLSNMSHEIRTPINAILGMDEMILRETEEPEIGKYAQDIHMAGRTLLGLVNDILDFSKIEAGKMEIIPVEYELCSMINDLSNMTMIRATEKNLCLDVKVNRNIPHLLYGDEIRIKQIILNVLTNAIKYTEQGGITLNLDFEKTGEDTIDFLVSVKDTGIGIKPEDLQRLFSPFERIEEERNRTIEGTGLGMSITKQLLDMMDSRLEVESVYGEGSCFSFRISQKVTKWEPMGAAAESFRQGQKQMISYKESFHAPDARILVVDDTPMNLTVVKNLLKKTKLQIDTAESGPQCLEMIEKKSYDMIFLDHRMPDMDGVETFGHMKERAQTARNRNIPVIVLTANAVSGMREQYLAEGFWDYLSKPIDANLLEQMIIKYLPVDKCQRVKPEEMNPSQEKNLPEEELAFLQTTGINVSDGITASGGQDFYITLLGEFADTVPERLNLVEHLAETGDWKNYTIQVHGLKSSARLIGATDLSEQAAVLESWGDAKQMDDTIPEPVEVSTKDFLARGRQLTEELQQHFKATQPQKDQLEEITEEALQEAYEALYEVVDAFDFDSADMVIKQLEEYRIPDEEQKKYNQLKILVTEVARDDIMELLKK